MCVDDHVQMTEFGKKMLGTWVYKPGSHKKIRIESTTGIVVYCQGESIVVQRDGHHRLSTLTKYWEPRPNLDYSI